MCFILISSYLEEFYVGFLHVGRPLNLIFQHHTVNSGSLTFVLNANFASIHEVKFINNKKSAKERGKYLHTLKTNVG